MDRKVTEYAVADRIATITLKRPERLNAWTGRMSFEYRAALAEASADESVRVIVVTGAGRGFCAGADSEALAGHVERGGYSNGLPENPPSPGYGVRAEFDADLAYHLGIEKPIVASASPPNSGCRGCSPASSVSLGPPTCCCRAGSFSPRRRGTWDS